MNNHQVLTARTLKVMRSLFVVPLSIMALAIALEPTSAASLTPSDSATATITAGPFPAISAGSLPPTITFLPLPIALIPGDVPPISGIATDHSGSGIKTVSYILTGGDITNATWTNIPPAAIVSPTQHFTVEASVHAPGCYMYEVIATDNLGDTSDIYLQWAKDFSTSSDTSQCPAPIGAGVPITSQPLPILAPSPSPVGPASPAPSPTTLPTPTPVPTVSPTSAPTATPTITPVATPTATPTAKAKTTVAKVTPTPLVAPTPVVSATPVSTTLAAIATPAASNSPAPTASGQVKGASTTSTNTSNKDAWFWIILILVVVTGGWYYYNYSGNKA